jgi:hypothetical protein
MDVLRITEFFENIEATVLFASDEKELLVFYKRKGYNKVKDDALLDRIIKETLVLDHTIPLIEMIEFVPEYDFHFLKVSGN